MANINVMGCGCPVTSTGIVHRGCINDPASHPWFPQGYPDVGRGETRPFSFTPRLSDEDVDRIAARVADKLRRG